MKGFSERVRKVLLYAREEAVRLSHDYVGTEHFLLGILKEGEGLAVRILEELDVNLYDLKTKLEAVSGPSNQDVFIAELKFTSRARKILEISVDEAKSLGSNVIDTEELMLAVLKDAGGVAARILAEFEVDYLRFRERLDEIQKQEHAESEDEGIKALGGKKSKTANLERFCRDLTALAKEGKLDPVIGREIEIERILQVLSRRKKNNPVLIGEPGVGKTAIVEGLSQRIVLSQVPDLLKQKRVLALDIASVVAGTKYRGQFEERVKNILREIKSADDVIIFIDEIHSLVGAGAAEGSIDASNMLKPALARGEIQCIGATTLTEYRKYIEKDGALERRFQSIMVHPPTIEQTVEILKGLRERYEKHHKVHYSDETIAFTVRLADRYINNRFLPDKAIDVIDEVGARLRLRLMEMSPELRELIIKRRELEEKKVQAIDGQAFEQAAQYRDEVKRLDSEIERLENEQRGDNASVYRDVTIKDIADVVSMISGVPVTVTEEVESQKLLDMEKIISKRIIGQEEAITTVARAIKRGRSGLKNPNRPIGSFIFAGPTGVGKTEMARVLAEFMFKSPHFLVRLDMSEYMEKFNVSRLIGAPPGYVGYEEGGQLTEKVRRQPYCVVLLDEIEKAHPDVWNILLQVLEDGQLTDAFGRRVDFRNTVLIMTTNVGSKDISIGRNMGFAGTFNKQSVYGQIKEKAGKELKRAFNPEFLNRVDEIVYFNELSKEDISKIVDLLLIEVSQKLLERDMELVVDDTAKNCIIEEGYKPSLGARPLRRTIEKIVEDALAEEILRGTFHDGDKIHVGSDEGKIVFSKG